MNVPVLKKKGWYMIMWLHMHKDRTKLLIKYYSNIIFNTLKIKIIQIVIEWFLVTYSMNV